MAITVPCTWNTRRCIGQCCYITTPARIHVDEQQLELLRETAYVVQSPDPLPLLLDELLADPQIEISSRQRLLDYCFSHLGASAARVVDVLEALGQPRQPVPERSTA